MSKSRNSNKICNYYKKNGHIKLHNREKKFGNKQGEKYGKSGETSVVESNQTDGELLIGTSSLHTSLCIKVWF